MHPFEQEDAKSGLYGEQSALVKQQRVGLPQRTEEEDPLRWECGERVPGRGNKRQEVGRSGYVKVGGDLFHGSPEQGPEEIKLPR